LAFKNGVIRHDSTNSNRQSQQELLIAH